MAHISHAIKSTHHPSTHVQFSLLPMRAYRIAHMRDAMPIWPSHDNGIQSLRINHERELHTNQRGGNSCDVSGHPWWAQSLSLAGTHKFSKCTHTCDGVTQTLYPSLHAHTALATMPTQP